MTKESFQSIIAPNPHVDKVVCIRDSINEVYQELKSQSYDYILDLHNNLRSRSLTLRLSGETFRLNKYNATKWKMVQKWFHGATKEVPHIVHRYMETAESLGVTYDGKGLDFFFESDPRDIWSPDIFIAFAIGGAHATKRLPRERIRKICEQLDVQILLLGGSDDQKTGHHIAEGLSHVTNFCGKVNICESAEILRRARAVITHDTGMMHIAAALGKPILSIWGNTVPGFGMWPFYADGSPPAEYRMEVTGLSCRPCSKIGHEECPQGHFKCMQDQRVEQIVLTAHSLLSDK